MHLLNRFVIHRVFAVLSVLFAIIGLSNAGSVQLSGLALALGAVFFVLFTIFTLLKGQKTDDEIAQENQARARDATRTMAPSPARKLAA